MTSAPPPPQQQQQRRVGIPGTGTFSSNHTQDPKSGLSGGAHALAGQDCHKSSAQSLPGVAAEKDHGDPTQQMDEQSHPSGNPFLDTFETSGARTLSVEEQRRLVQQWKAQGRKACRTRGAKHSPPCNPGIVKKKKTSKVMTPWCRSCQEHHLLGKHTRAKQEVATLLTQQAYGMAPVPTPMMTAGEPEVMNEHFAGAELNSEIRMMLIHQVPQLLRNFRYQEKLDLRSDLFPDHIITALTWEQHVFMQYLQE